MTDSIFTRGYRAADKPDDADMRVVASTSDVARDGMIVDAAGWQLDNFRLNPVFAFGHRYDIPPIGQVTRIDVRDGQLIADVRFDTDEFSQLVKAKYESGSMRAVSVGWHTLDMQPGRGKEPPRITKAELFELSAVPVPADPKALKQHQLRAFEAMGREFLTLTDTDSDDAPDELDWQGTALQMLRLCSPAASDLSDAERKRLYDRLEARYRRAGKTAPELLPIAHLEALDGDTWRGLWFHDEPDLLPDWFPAARAGAVLSKRNADDLSQAMRLIDGVIQRATKEDATGDDGESEQRALKPDAGTLKALLSALGE
jgi:hypothetical protein